MNIELSYDLNIKMKILKEQGYELTADVIVLDFGCGAGGVVKELRANGINAYGCDIGFKKCHGIETDEMSARNELRLIDTKPYKIPFNDNTFDFVFSDQVFEHVQNYEESLSEISRILKPGGCCLHIFPSRYKPIEAHVLVPFSSIFGSYSWMLLWAKLGLRTKQQKGLSAKEIAARNYEYLKNNTNYLTKSQLIAEFNRFFDKTAFLEKTFLKYSGRGKYVYALSKYIPFLPALYSILRARVVVTQNPKKVIDSRSGCVVAVNPPYDSPSEVYVSANSQR